MFHDQDIVAIANGEPPSSALLFSLLSPQKKLVAIDGGLHVCEQFQLKPDLITGDFDSATPELLKKYHTCPQVSMPDQTMCDLEKTLEYLFSFSCRSVVVLGATGRRIDHTLTNICLLCRYPEKVKFETEKEVFFALPQQIEVACKVGQTLSLIPYGEATQVRTKGLQWELNGETMSTHFVGISNVAHQEKVSISFEKGNLIICLYPNNLKN